MFNDIREQRKNTFTYILVGLAGVGMLFLGKPLFSHSPTEQNILKVNDTEVPVSALKSQVSRLQKQFPDMDTKVIEQQALSQLVNQSLLDQHALNSGYKFSKPALFKLVKEQYGNNDDYQAALAKMRITASTYEAAISRQQTIQNYYRFISNSDITQKAIFEQYLRSTSQTRDYTLLRLPLAPVLDSIKVSDDEIKTYYDSHQEQYQTPELVDLEYVILDATKMVNDEQITTQDIEEAQQNAIRENTKRSGRYIIFDNDAQATQAKQSLDDHKQSFDDIYSAIDKGEVAGEAGELMLGTHGSGPSVVVDDALFALDKSGDVSDLLSTDYGKMLVSLNEIQTTAIPSKEEIIANLRAKAGEEEYYDRAAKAFDAALANKPFSQIVDITGAQVQKLSQVSADMSEPQWLQNDTITKQLFGDEAIAIDKIGEPIELNDQRSVFYRVVDRTNPTVRPLSDVTKLVEKDIRTDKANKLLEERSQHLAKALRDDEDVNSLIGQYHVSKEILNSISLYDSPDLDKNLLKTLFNQEQRVSITTTDNGDWIVSYLDAVHEGDLDKVPQDMQDALFRQWQNTKNIERQNTYSQWLRDKADIKIYEDNLPSSSL